MRILSKLHSDITTLTMLIARMTRLTILIAIAAIVYKLIFVNVLLDERIVTGVVVLWVFTAYLVLPRVHRYLTKIYVPDYYIGRVKTVDGVLGDPVNLAFIGTKAQIITTMKEAGWTRADELNTKSTLKMISSALLRKSYERAPVSSLFLFGNKQDMAFQQEVNNNPARRHHIRLWKTPGNWYLPGGKQADWLAAATYDRSVGFSLFTLQITHKIAENTDEERDFVVKSLASNKKVSIEIIDNFSTSYHCKNGGGDRIKTDGAMPFVAIGNS
jgi:hypothetical protein